MLWRGLLGYLPVNLVQALAGFGAVVVFTRLLSPADYGAYALGFSVAALAGTCVFIWLESAVARFHAAERAGPERAAMFATVYRIFAVLALAAPVLAAGAVWLLPL